MTDNALELPSAVDIARYFLHCARCCDDAPVCLSHRHLHALLYLTQGWSLAQRNKPIFKEDIHAGMTGPWIRSIYDAFRDYISHRNYEINIPFAESEKINIQKFNESNLKYESDFIPEKNDYYTLNCETTDYLDIIWNTYKFHSVLSLIKECRESFPYYETFRKNNYTDGDDLEMISHELMKEHFLSEISIDRDCIRKEAFEEAHDTIIKYQKDNHSVLTTESVAIEELALKVKNLGANHDSNSRIPNF